MKPEHITAWALNEASAEERQQLEAALRDNPKTKQAAEETKEFCHFLLAELRDESLALTDTQREKLKAQPMMTPIKSDAQKPELRTKWRTGVIVRLAIAACVALGGFWTWHAFEAKQTAPTVAAVDEEKYNIQPVRRSEIDKLERSASDARLLAETPVKATVIERELERVAGKPPAPAPAPLADSTPAARPLALNKNLGTMSAGDVATLKQIQDQNGYGLNFGNTTIAPASGPVAVGQGAVTLGGSVSGASGIVKVGAGTLTLGDASNYTGDTKVNAGTVTFNGGTIMPPAAPSSGSLTIAGAAGIPSTMSAVKSDPSIAGNAPMPVNAGATLDLNGFTQIMGTIGGDAAKTNGTPPPALSTPTSLTRSAGNTLTLSSGVVVTSPSSDAFYFASVNGSNTTAREQESVVGGWAEMKDSRSAGESYTRIIENELKDVAREPLSTLSIDVDTASYANVRRFLNQNMIPPPDAVRIEELVNYFPTAEEGPAHDAKEPFAVRVELAPCPWQPVHRLARIAIKGREIGQDRKASNLVFLVDVSGSMNEPAKLPLVQQSLRMLTEQLGEGDRVTMVVYAGSSGVVLPPTNGEKKAEILAAIDKLQAGGSTHGSAGIKLAYDLAMHGFIKDGVNRVILCTDGDFNVGVSSPEELEKLITHKAKSGVFLSVLGFGSGNLKDRTMETLADKGNGNYAYIDSLSEARKVLVEQMSGTLVTIAKDVKIQVEFNPAAVRSYRLIGYENRLLAKEDFNDDTKDAGEIGAGHSVVALYEVVPANLPPGAEPRPAVDGLKYQTPAIAPAQLAEAAKSGEMMTVKLRYKAPDSDLSKLIEVPTKDEGKTLTASSEEYKFSAAVAGFGLLLRDSAYKGTLGWETVRRLALDGKGADKLGYRGEFLQLIDKARGLKETRP